MTQGVDATAVQRRTVRSLLRRHVPDLQVWAYGSRIRWTARANSDLDIVVFAKPSEHRQVMELKDAMQESNLPFIVDVHIWDELPESFHRIITKEHIVLQAASEKY